MTTGLLQTLSFFRGQTIRFHASFVDFDGNPVQPVAAQVVVQYDSVPNGPDQELTIAMTPGTPYWTAVLDTRNFAAPRTVQWSVESLGVAPIPVAVADGNFMLTANQANQPTF